MSEETIPSFTAQLRGLKRGDSVARAKRFEIGTVEADAITEELDALRRNVNASVSRVRGKVPGSNFRVESGTMLTNDNKALIAVVNISRL